MDDRRKIETVVIIGTTGPGYKLDVNGTGNFSGTASFNGGNAADFNTFPVIVANNKYLQLRNEPY